MHDSNQIQLCLLLIPTHRKFLRRVVSDIRNFRIALPLIVVASGFNSKDRKRLERFFSRSSLEITLIHAEKGSVGANRNKALSVCSAKYLAFLDSDDRYFKNYTLDLVSALSDFKGLDVYMHSYIAKKGRLADRAHSELSIMIGEEGELVRKEIRSESEAEVMKLARGHMMLRVDTGRRIGFHEDPLNRNEDSVFIRQAFAEGLRVVGSTAQTSIYRMGSSAFFLRDRVKRALSRNVRQS